MMGPIGPPAPAGQAGTAGPPSTAVAVPRARAVVAAALLAVGVGCGIAGLFPGYLGGTSLAQQPAQLVTHAIFLAVWSASALLILRGGALVRAGALLGLGTSIVTFGLFFADAGTAIAGGAHVMGPASCSGSSAGSRARPGPRRRSGSAGPSCRAGEADVTGAAS